MDSLSVNGVTYWLPANEEDVITLVNEAKANNEIICIRGAAHSFPLIGTLEKGPANGKKYKYLMLSNMDVVTFPEKNMVTVKAGCHLGPDPWDPTGKSTAANSLLVQLNNAGLSIPDLGGITHQTIGGFLSTSSSGGSTQFSFDDALMSIDIICCGTDGAKKVTFNRPVPDNPDDPFYGAGVATMGLFGVIVSATFKCSPQFFIAGQEAITTVADCEIDLFGPGNATKPGIADFFTTTQYTRLMWWPQQNVTKMVVWKAWQTDKQGAADWAAQAYTKIGTPAPPFPPLKPYQEVPGGPFKGPTMATLGADILFTAIGKWPQWLMTVLGDTDEYQHLKTGIESMFYPELLPMILGFFVTPDSPTNANKGPQQFSDLWYTGLPMDNQMSDKLMPVWFTELWIPIDQSQNVMNDLLNFYDGGSANTGPFSCEIYAAKNSPFWLSPAYETDVIRIDVFWFANNIGDPVLFYQKFWNLLAKYKFRPHWGKYIPDEIIEPDNKVTTGPDYLKSCYPKWDAWMALREKMDPHQVFVNDYWRAKMGISPVS